MTALGKIETVFFDAAGTLFRVRDGVGATYARIGGRFGLGAATEPGFDRRLDRAFGAAFRRREPMAFPGARRDELLQMERSWWLEVVRETFDSLGTPFPRVEDFFKEVYAHFATGSAWVLEPGCRETLGLLKARGLKLGVISNFDSRLENVLASLGIREFFETVTISSVCGSAKPDPEIFLRALRDAKADSAKSSHVGDDTEDDWQGAGGVGMRAVLYDPRRRHMSHPGERVETLAELAGFLV